MGDQDGSDRGGQVPPTGSKKRLVGVIALASVLALTLGGIITMAINNNASISADVAMLGSGASSVVSPRAVSSSTFSPGAGISRPAYTPSSTPVTPTPITTQTSRVDACRAACAGQGKTCNESNFTCYGGLSTSSPIATTSSGATDSVAIQQCNNASFPATTSHLGKQCQWKYTNQTMTSGYCSCSQIDTDGNVVGGLWTAVISVTPTSSKTAAVSAAVSSPTSSKTIAAPVPTPTVSSGTGDDAKIKKCNESSYDATSKHNGKLCQWTYDNKTLTSGYCVCHWVDANGEFIGGDNGWITQLNTATGVKGAVITAYQSVANFFASLWARIF